MQSGSRTPWISANNHSCIMYRLAASSWIPNVLIETIYFADDKHTAAAPPPPSSDVCECRQLFFWHAWDMAGLQCVKPLYNFHLSIVVLIGRAIVWVLLTQRQRLGLARRVDGALSLGMILKTSPSTSPSVWPVPEELWQRERATIAMLCAQTVFSCILFFFFSHMALW